MRKIKYIDKDSIYVYYEANELCLITLFKILKNKKYFIRLYRVSQEERTKLREGVPYVKLYRYNPKHL